MLLTRIPSDRTIHVGVCVLIVLLVSTVSSTHRFLLATGVILTSLSLDLLIEWTFWQRRRALRSLPDPTEDPEELEWQEGPEERDRLKETDCGFRGNALLGGRPGCECTWCTLDRRDRDAVHELLKAAVREVLHEER